MAEENIKIYTLEVEERQLVTYRVPAVSLEDAKEQIESGYGTDIDREDATIPENAEFSLISIEDE